MEGRRICYAIEKKKQMRSEVLHVKCCGVLCTDSIVMWAAVHEKTF